MKKQVTYAILLVIGIIMFKISRQHIVRDIQDAIGGEIFFVILPAMCKCWFDMITEFIEEVRGYTYE